MPHIHSSDRSSTSSPSKYRSGTFLPLTKAECRQKLSQERSETTNVQPVSEPEADKERQGIRLQSCHSALQTRHGERYPTHTEQLPWNRFYTDVKGARLWFKSPPPSQDTTIPGTDPNLPPHRAARLSPYHMLYPGMEYV
ncbi:hypothetical protein Bbelb_003700 [Branchiostoma belcheri]|nr:hypothetical protein Bbelb_003700 [Branchiostoma belcheri]